MPEPYALYQALDIPIPADAPVVQPAESIQVFPREDGGHAIVLVDVPKKGFFGSGAHLIVGIKNPTIKTCIGVWCPDPAKIGPPNPKGFASPALGQPPSTHHSNSRNVPKGRAALLIREQAPDGSLVPLAHQISLLVRINNWRAGIFG